MNKGLIGAMALWSLVFIIGFVGFLAVSGILVNIPFVLGQAQNATTNNMTLVTPSPTTLNNTMFSNQVPFALNLSIVNSSSPTPIQYVEVVFYNSTTATFYNLTNTTAIWNTTHQYYHNGSVFSFASCYNSTKGDGCFRNLTFRAWNITGAQYEWFNDTAANAVFNWTLNEFPAQGRALTFASPTPANATNHTTSTAIAINFTSNATVMRAFAVVNGTQTVVTLTVRANNLTADNATTVVRYDDSKFGQLQNLTAYVEDSFGNRSYFNTSTTAYPRYYRIDATNAIIGPITVTLGNITTESSLKGTYLNVTWFVADNTTHNGTLKVYDSNNVTRIVRGIPIGSAAENQSYMANITGNTSVIEGTGVWVWPDGLLRIEPQGTDIGRTTAGTNQTWVRYNVSAGSKLNIVTWYSNFTLTQIAQQAPNITHVSVYNNTIGFKNFTTFATSASTNANIAINESLNATFIRASENNVLFLQWRQGAFIRTNNTLETGGWNFLGLRGIINNLNETMYCTTCYGNYSTGQTGPAASDMTANITYVSIYNSTSQTWCTARRGFTQTSCSPTYNVTNLVAPEGWTYALLANANITANATAIAPIRG